MKILENNILDIGSNTHGTRVIQKVVEIFTIKGIEDEHYQKAFEILVNHIVKDVVLLSSDSNSSHIVIKFVLQIKYPLNKEVYESVNVNFMPRKINLKLTK